MEYQKVGKCVNKRRTPPERYKNSSGGLLILNMKEVTFTFIFQTGGMA